MLLRIENLSVAAVTPQGKKAIVDNISLDVGRERIVALVGGSGSGKTTTGMAILRLLLPPLNIKCGRIIFEGNDLLNFSSAAMRQVRARKIAMVFQEPLNAMNPVFTIGQQIEEVLAAHTKLGQRQRQGKALELLRQADISEPRRIANSYPHQLSGGLRQRAMIAQAIALEPRLIIADEPTSNLDVTVQARIIELFRRLRADQKVSVLLITHDLGLVRHFADEVAVMHQGEIIERGPVGAVMSAPRQEYTKELVKTIA